MSGHIVPYADVEKQKEWTREWSKRQKPEMHRERTMRWRLSNPRGYMLSRAKSRAAKKGISFSITVDDIIIPAVCPVFPWITLRMNSGLAADDSPSLDRIDSSKGYNPGNVRVISLRANIMKSNMSPKEARHILADLETINVQDHRYRDVPLL